MLIDATMLHYTGSDARREILLTTGTRYSAEIRQGDAGEYRRALQRAAGRKPNTRARASASAGGE